MESSPNPNEVIVEVLFMQALYMFESNIAMLAARTWDPGLK